MAQYHGENVHGILDCVKGVLTAWKLTLLVSFYCLLAQYGGENVNQLGYFQLCHNRFKFVFLMGLFTVYMAQYDGENIFCNLGCPMGGLVASKSSLLE